VQFHKVVEKWVSAEMFPGGQHRHFAFCSGYWRCSADGRSQNALPFPH